MTEMDDQQRLKAIQHSMVPRIRTEGADSKQAPHTPLKCRCLSCINAELLEALKAAKQFLYEIRCELMEEKGPEIPVWPVEAQIEAAIAHAERKEQVR